jgi:hypothetical protein
MGRVIKTRILVAVAMLMAAAASSACDSTRAGDGSNPVAITPQEAAKEYIEEENHLRLPDDWRWPSKISYPLSGPDGHRMYYQGGYGTTQADHYWYCSWMSVYVTAAADSSRHEVAKEEIQRVFQTHMYKYDIIAVDRPLFDKVVSTALAGDIHLMRQNVTLNCPKS